MADGMTLAPGSVFAAEYRIVRPIGEGRTEGVVYVAEQIATGSERALKVLPKSLIADPGARQRFEQETRVGSRIQSEHVVQVIGAGVDAVTGLPWVATELLQGEDLAALIARRGSLPIAEVVAIFEQLCHALGAAHDGSIVHRDLKPENVFMATPRQVGASFLVKVLDFGMGKLMAEARIAASPSAEDLLWLAPEQIDRKLGIVPSTDVWALGLLAYRLLVGRTYWNETSAEGLGREVLSDPIAPASQRAAEQGAGDRVPPGFDEWFARCVVREQGKRFADAREAFFDLGRRTGVRQAAAFGAPAQPPAPPPQAAPPPVPSWGSPQAAQPPYGAPPPYGPAPSWGPPPPARSTGGSGVVIAAVAGFIGFIVLIGALTAVVLLRARTPPPAPAPVAGLDEGIGAGGAWSDEDCPVPVSSNDPTWGSRSAPVTIVVFSDFECPFCKRAEDTMTQLRARYGADKLRIVWKNNPLPFHKNARSTAAAAVTVFELGGSSAFWSFHGAAFASQKDLSPDNHELWARSAGVDMTRFRTAQSSGRSEAKVDADLALGKQIGVTGTPAFFINGIFVSGAQPVDKFQTYIDAELAAAAADVSMGTRADRVYVERTKQNKANAPPPSKPKATDAPDDATVWKVPVGDSPSRGSATALVTIVMFSDFQCPFCAKVEPTLTQVSEAYGSKVRIVWKNNPLAFHARAEPAAELALEARKQQGDSGFWEAHDLLFENQQSLDDAALEGYARKLGLDVGRARTAIRERSHSAAIRADQDLADEIGASGTPSFFINGRSLTGAQPLERFKAIIDEEIAKAQKLVARGVAPGDVYAEIIKDGKGAPAAERKEVGAAPASSPFRGPAGAPVTMHVFSEFQCPFCKRAAPTIDELAEQYGDRLKIVWRHKPLPFHKDAQLAAEAAQEAFVQQGNKGFWRYHDKLFANQTSLDRESLERYGQEQGLDLGKLRRALDQRTHRALVDAESRAADDAGISGTPSFVINGYFVSGAQPRAKFTKVIDRALKERGR